MSTGASFYGSSSTGEGILDCNCRLVILRVRLSICVALMSGGGVYVHLGGQPDHECGSSVLCFCDARSSALSTHTAERVVCFARAGWALASASKGTRRRANWKWKRSTGGHRCSGGGCSGRERRGCG
eukprot:3590440-Rhodomonas_salina.1